MITPQLYSHSPLPHQGRTRRQLPVGSTARGLESDPRCGRAVCWLGVDPWLREHICPGVDRGQVPRASPGDEGDLSKAATGNRCCLQAGREREEGAPAWVFLSLMGKVPSTHLEGGARHQEFYSKICLCMKANRGWIINRHPSNERAPPPRFSSLL